jgi:predicted CopG family antitoxin
MQNLQISDDVATQLHEMAEHEHTSVTELMEQLVKTYKKQMTKQNELKEFFKPHKKNMAGYKFNRDEANER